LQIELCDDQHDHEDGHEDGLDHEDVHEHEMTRTRTMLPTYKTMAAECLVSSSSSSTWCWY
jgi:hypothetical protein